MSTPSELVPVPAVTFDKVRTYAVPAGGEEVIVLYYQPRAGKGYVIANSWHERSGIVTVVLRQASDRAAADAQAAASYGL